MSPEILLSIIKLAAGGIVTFLAILLMSRIRELSWTFIVSGFLFNYAATIYDIMIKLGVLSQFGISVAGIPVVTLVATVLPSFLFIIGLIILLFKK